MRRLFYGNFDFEHQLAWGRPQTAPAMQRLCAELASSWLPVAADGDYLWSPLPIPPEFAEHCRAENLPRLVPVTDLGNAVGAIELVPWGWSQHCWQQREIRGWSGQAPPFSAVLMVNSRRFSACLEEEWLVGPPGAAMARSVGELSQAIADLPPDYPKWVIKAEFSNSARERILGEGDPTPQQLAWVKRRLEGQGAVFLEPWLDRIAEAGMQWQIPPVGPISFQGLTPLLTTPRGDYRGSRFLPSPEEEAAWQPAIEFGERAAREAQRLGYFGPLGIDAMQYRDPGGGVRWRPLQDVNARWTMGRLSLGFRRWMPPHAHGEWWHGPAAELQMSSAEVRVVRTSPNVIDGAPALHASAVLWASPESPPRSSPAAESI